MWPGSRPRVGRIHRQLDLFAVAVKCCREELQEAGKTEQGRFSGDAVNPTRAVQAWKPWPSVIRSSTSAYRMGIAAWPTPEAAPAGALLRSIPTAVATSEPKTVSSEPESSKPR